MKKRMVMKVVSFACSFAIALTSLPLSSQCVFAEDNNVSVSSVIEEYDDDSTDDEIKYIETENFKIIDDGNVDEEDIEFFSDSSRIYDIEDTGDSENGLLIPVYKNNKGEVLDIQKTEDDKIVNIGVDESEIPEKYDLRDYDRVASLIEDQKTTSTCWAHAAIEACESNMITNGLIGKGANYSEAHLAWFGLGKASEEMNDPLYMDSRNQYSRVYNSGGTEHDAEITLVSGRGLQYESELPDVTLEKDLTGYESQRYVSHGLLINTNKYDIMSTNAKAYDKEMYAAVKKQIINEGAMELFYGYYSNYYDRNNNAQYCNAQLTPNHAVAIIGWDDNYRADGYVSGKPAPGNGAWLCKNSWGNYNNMEGCFWISYYDRTLQVAESYEVVDREEYGKIYQYFGNQRGVHDISEKLGYAQACIFTAEEDDYISAVGFDTYSNNSKVELQVYRNVGKEPQSGELVYENKILSYEMAGYHLVDLPEIFSVKKDENFSVVIKVECNNSVIVIDSHKYKEGACFLGTLNDTGITWAETKDYDCNLKAYSCGQKSGYIKSTAEEGTYCGSVSINFISPVADAKIVYTIDGTTPNLESSYYSEPIVLTYDKEEGAKDYEVKARLVVNGELDRKISTFRYRIVGNDIYIYLDPKGGTLSSNSLKPVCVDRSKPISGLSYPVKQGYDFTGWYSKGKLIDNGMMLPDNLKSQEIYAIAKYAQVKLVVGQRTEVTDILAPYISDNEAEQYRFKVEKNRGKIVKEGDSYYLVAKKAGISKILIQKKEGKKWKSTVGVFNFKVIKPKFKTIKVSKNKGTANLMELDTNKYSNYPLTYATTFEWSIKNPKKKKVAEINEVTGDVKILNPGTAKVYLQMKREGGTTKKFKFNLKVLKK